ncbi:pirin family protein [Occultella glacieicola]|uniref:Pirin family protein n=1 Tax=Occultella glacieicola TaxID=2518684 RepID=A0ABY2E9Q2_9MICO|nr:pirin family protein [Occultella glacieicola]TDE99023.1 pirin family protein [Occultella glacieicola]
MTNLEVRPTETLATPSGTCESRFEVFDAREVPLGGIRGILVRRTLPQRALPTVGGWCFLDQFGPSTDVPMEVLPHPHTGLQTVTWPMSGEIHHRDSLGNDVWVRPGELNLMTSGRNISHSEFSEPGELLGLQFWAALPSGAAEGEPSFQQVRDLPVLEADGVRIIVFVGCLGGVVSPAVVHTPLLGADAAFGSGARSTLALRPDFEHAVLVISGSLVVDGRDLEPGPLAYLGAGRSDLTLAAGPDGARFVLLGGTPFEEDLVMFWNFVGRSHEEVAAARADWQADADLPPEQRRFGFVAGHGEQRIPSPDLPNVRLSPRRRRPAS